ncbi:phage tail tape measure protein [Vibrio ruber]|uniref:phage tail tape measure protein n=1 Tax=Vibrio ruber TaxID=184755 RepID=UPI002892E319|nr:phage tail tape measure protein [Vibrio ruber]WNJ96536.1 phage tail tape measure protein [Vibrio ruber]
MQQQLVSEFVINMSGNMVAKAKAYGGAMNRFAKKNSRAMSIVRNSTREASKALDKIQNRYTGAATAFATGTMVKGVADFDKIIRRMGTNAQMSDEQVASLRESIKAIADQDDIRIDMSLLAEGVDELQSLTGNAVFVKDNIRNIGLAMQGFGVDAKVAAQLIAQFYEKGITGGQEVEQTFDMLFGQFAKGSLNVSDIARVAPSLFSIIQDKGPGAIAQMGGLAQIFKKNKGSAEEVVTSIQGIYSALANKQNIQFLKNQGVDVFVENTKDLKKPVELLNEVLKAADYDRLQLQDVFSDTDMEGLSSLLKPENRKLLDDMVHGTYELGYTQKAAEKNAHGFYGAMTRMNNQLLAFADDNLAEPLNELADAIGSLDSKTVKAGLETLVTGAALIGGYLTIRGGYRMGKGGYDVMKRIFGTNKKGAGKDGAFDLGVQRVFVVNMKDWSSNNSLKPDMPESNRKGGRFRRLFSSASQIAKATTVGYGLTMTPEFSPISFTRKEKRTTGLNDNEKMLVTPGILDVWDEVKQAFSSLQTLPTHPTPPEGSSGYVTGNYNLPQPSTGYPALNGRIDVNVRTSHDGRKPQVSVDVSGLPGQAMVN